MKRTFPMLFCALAMAVATRMPAYGWADEGHKMIGEIAWQQMTPQARAAVTGLLSGEERPYRTLAGAGTWADAVRKEPAYKATAATHFVNIARGESTYVKERDCPGGGCIVEAIHAHIAVLRDTKAEPAARREALKLLTHLVGDIHQPWHVGNVEDRGGNTLPARYRSFWVISHDTNIHVLWDLVLVKQAMRRYGWRRAAREMAGSITPAQRAAWTAATTPEAWAGESRRIFIDEKLDQYPAGGMLGRDYSRKYVPLVRERLQIAGTRLADLLNKVALVDGFASP